MRRALIVAIVLAVALFAYSDPVSDYLEQVTTRLLEMGQIRQGNFAFSIFPVTPEYLILTAYPGWKEREYTPERMVQHARSLIATSESRLWARLVVRYVGSQDAEGETSFEIDPDLFEYIYLENDAGHSARACPTRDPEFATTITVNQAHDSANVALWFPKNPAYGNPVLHGTERVHFVIEDLGLKDTPVSFPARFELLFKDSPLEVQKLFVQSGLWQETFPPATR